MNTPRTTILPAIAAILALTPLSIRAQEITVGGQLRPRYELAAGGGEADAFVSMRARLTVSAKLEKDVTVFIQVQDVRLWGEETNTLGDFSADNFDLHQGYIQFERPGETQLVARIGRQEISLGGQRLVGAVGWTQQARSFDGIGLVANSDAFRIDLIGAVLTDATSANNADDTWFVLAHSQIKKAGPGTLDLYGIFNSADLGNTDQGTLGARYWGQTTGGITFRAEGTYQTGTRAGLDVNAFMFGARLGKKFGRGSITLWYDYLSGDDNTLDDGVTDTETKVFSTLFATNHKFYGFADLFLNIPAHTAKLGLQDISIKGSYSINAQSSLAIQLHNFQRVQTPGALSSNLANEVDLTLKHRYSANTAFTVGFSHVMADDAWASRFAGGAPGTNRTWFYVMTNATF